MWVLGDELGAFRRAASALACHTQLQPQDNILFKRRELSKARSYTLKPVGRLNRMHHRLATGNKRGDGNEPGFKFMESECFIDAGWTVMGRLKLP